MTFLAGSSIVAMSSHSIENRCKRFYRSPKHQSIRWMTIDRIENEKGYEPENMVKACWICNSLKGDFFDGEQMKKIAPQIIARLEREIEKEKVSQSAPADSQTHR